MEQPTPAAGRRCAGCSGPLPESRGYKPRKWCSERCRRTGYRWQPPPTSPPDRTCVICSTIWQGRKRATCSPECAAELKRWNGRAHYEANLERERQRFREFRAAQHGIRYCVDCGVRVWGDRDRHTHRCSSCGMTYRERQRRFECKVARLQRLIRKSASGTSANPRWPWVQGDCGFCGERFTRKGGASPYCSRSCSSKAKRRRAKWISRKQRFAIYDRDKWICQLCLEPVDPDLHHLDDWAPSLDHIVHWSSSAAPDNSPENLRLAHRWCNSVRGVGEFPFDPDMGLAA